MSPGSERSSTSSRPHGRGESRRAELTLQAEPASVPLARRFVASLDFVAQLDIDRLVLLTAEVVTNAVLHARTMLRIAVREIEGGVRVSVHDGSLSPPVKKDYGILSPTGRGLRIVDALATRWGYESSDSGKTVWFELEPEKEPA